MMNNTLTELDLRNNRIGPQGVVSLAQALKKNTSLTRVGIAKARLSNFEI